MFFSSDVKKKLDFPYDVQCAHKQSFPKKRAGNNRAFLGPNFPRYRSHIYLNHKNSIFAGNELDDMKMKILKFEQNRTSNFRDLAK